MRQLAKIPVPNAMLFVMDFGEGEVPDALDENGIGATPSCVAFGTLPAVDGETEVVLSDEPPDGTPWTQLFDGVLKTPNRRIAVCSVENEVLMELEVAGQWTRVRLLANDRREPDKVVILVQEGPVT